MPFSFFTYLQQNKELILRGEERGGREDVSTPTVITPSTPCDESVSFSTIFTDPYILTLSWNEMFSNGIVNIILDEYYNERWNRRLLVGIASPTTVTMVESGDGIQGSITEKCGIFYLERYRVTTGLIPNEKTLVMSSSDGKKITIQERNQLLNCQSKNPR